MTKTDFIVDSKGHCFLCLSQLPFQIKCDPGTESLRVNPSSEIYSIQYLFHYLKLDRRKMFKGEDELIPPILVEQVERSILKVELCQECAHLSERFSSMYRQLEKMEMEVAECLSSIHGKLAKAEGEGRTERFREDLNEVSSKSLGGMMEKWQRRFVEALRREALQKCSQKLNAVKPRIKLPAPLFNKANQNGNKHKVKVSKNKNQKIKIKREESPPLLSPPFQSNVFHQQPPTLQIQDMEMSPTKSEPSLPDLITNAEPLPLKEKGSKVSLKSNQKNKIKGRSLPNFNPQTGHHKCTICSDDFPSYHKYWRHVNEVHKKLQFKCNLCGKEFMSQSGRYKHMKINHGEKKPTCAVCGRTFTQSPSLKRHLMKGRCPGQKKGGVRKNEGGQGVTTNVEAKTMECDICHLQVSDLSIHLYTTHFERKEEQSNQEPLPAGEILKAVLGGNNENGAQPPQPSKKRLSSAKPKKSKRGFPFKKKRKVKKKKLNDLDINITSTTSVKIIISDDTKEDAAAAAGVVPTPLKVTTESDVDKVGVIRSIVNPETGQHTCVTCYRQYETSSAFRLHYRRDHLSVKYQCRVCGGEFTQPESYKTHYQNLHMGGDGVEGGGGEVKDQAQQLP